MNIQSLYSSVQKGKNLPVAKSTKPDQVEIEVWDLDDSPKPESIMKTADPKIDKSVDAVTPKPSEPKNGWIYDRTQAVKPEPSGVDEINPETLNGVQVDNATAGKVKGELADLLGASQSIGAQMDLKQFDKNDWTVGSNVTPDPQFSWLINQKLYSNELADLDGSDKSDELHAAAVKSIIHAAETMTGIDQVRIALKEQQSIQAKQHAEKKLELIEAINFVIDSNRPDVIAAISETVYGEWFATAEQIKTNYTRFEFVKAKLKQEIAIQPLRVLESCVHILRQFNF